MTNVEKLEQEVLKLRAELATSHAELAESQNELAEKRTEIERLYEAIRLNNAKKFGSSSEKESADQLGLFDEPEASLGELSDDELATLAKSESVSEVEAGEAETDKKTENKRPRAAIPEHLPREVKEYDLPESEKVCPHDHTQLVRIGTEDHDQLEIIPAKVKVIRHSRVKYACPCCEQYHVTASKPKQPIEKSIASPSVLAYTATQKYGYAMPLYRQAAMFEQAGFTLDRTNLANWMIKVGDCLQPLINLLKEKVLEQKVVHLDETTVQVLNEPDKNAESKSYMWLMACLGGQPVRLFEYHPTRSQSVPLNLLDTNANTIMVDGYEGYSKACEEYGITRLGCMAHVRRKFMDVNLWT